MSTPGTTKLFDDAHLSRAFQALEGAIHDVDRMAFIVMDVAEDYIGNPSNMDSAESGMHTVRLTTDQLEALIFLTIETHSKARALKDKYHAAFEEMPK